LELNPPPSERLPHKPSKKQSSRKKSPAIGQHWKFIKGLMKSSGAYSFKEALRRLTPEGKLIVSGIQEAALLDLN